MSRPPGTSDVNVQPLLYTSDAPRVPSRCYSFQCILRVTIYVVCVRVFTYSKVRSVRTFP